MSFQFWRRWLMAVMAAVILYSLAIMIFSETMQTLFNSLFFGFAPSVFSTEANAYIRLVQGVLGAVMIGWMTALWLLVALLFGQPDRRVWTILTLSIGVWFVLDTGFSVWIGVLAHAVFNVPFLVLFALPLVAIYQQIDNSSARS